MILTGIADEASDTLEGQLKAHQALGWNSIELRTILGKNIAGALGEREFAQAADLIKAAGMQVPAFASAIGNWSRHIEDAFDQDIEDLKITLPRMHRLGTKYLRTMSWVGDGVSDARWRKETIRRYRELARMAEDGGIFLAHENCTGWAGQSARNMRDLIEEVGSDHLVVLFDIGNTISHGHEPWPFYEGIKDLIRYVHVKDCRRNPRGGRSQAYAWVGEGDAMVEQVLSDFLGDGYDGVISIEPHVAKIVHDSQVKPDPQQMYESYLRYARRFVSLVRRIQGKAEASHEWHETAAV